MSWTSFQSISDLMSNGVFDYHSSLFRIRIMIFLDLTHTSNTTAKQHQRDDRRRMRKTDVQKIKASIKNEV
jgi:hypothetical protein